MYSLMPFELNFSNFNPFRLLNFSLGRQNNTSAEQQQKKEKVSEAAHDSFRRVKNFFSLGGKQEKNIRVSQKPPHPPS